MCVTNRFLNGNILFVINDNVPLLIGQGEVPRIWINIPTDPKAMNWMPLIQDNKSMHPKVKVSIVSKSIIIDTTDGIVLNVEKYKTNIARILLIDFRLFGLNIFGNDVSLNIMNNNFKSNSFDSNIMFVLKTTNENNKN